MSDIAKRKLNLKTVFLFLILFLCFNLFGADGNLIFEKADGEVTIEFEPSGIFKTTVEIEDNSIQTPLGSFIIEKNGVEKLVFNDEKVHVEQDVIRDYVNQGIIVPSDAVRFYTDNFNSPQVVSCPNGDLLVLTRVIEPFNGLLLEDEEIGNAEIDDLTSGLQNNGTFVIETFGGNGIGGIEDDCAFYYNKLFRNTVTSSEFGSIEGANDIQTGIMYRESNAPGSRCVALMYTGDKKLFLMWRLELDQQMEELKISDNIDLEDLKIAKYNNTFCFFYKRQGDDDYIQCPKNIVLITFRSMRAGIFASCGQTGVGRCKVVLTDADIVNEPDFRREYAYQSSKQDKPVITTEYYDGMGNAIQSHSMLDNVTSLITGDIYNRSGLLENNIKSVMVQGANFQYFDGNLIEIAQNEHADDIPYSELVYSQDALRRQMKVGAIGEKYSISDSKHTEYYYFGVDTKNSFVSSANLAANKVEPPQPTNPKYYLTVEKDPMGNYYQVITDKFGDIVSTRGNVDGTATGEIDSYINYDVNGRIIDQIPAAPFGEDYKRHDDYNLLGQLTQNETPDAGITEFKEYDKVSRLKEKVKPDDVTLEYTYDELGRLIIISVDVDPVSINKIIKVYDNAINLNSAYNVPTHIVEELTNLQGNLVLELAYDESGVESEEHRVTDVYSYNNDSRIAAKYKKIPGLPWQKINFNYDLQGRVTKETLYSSYDKGAISEPFLKTYTYTRKGELQTVARVEANQNIPMISYTYYNLGLLNTKTYHKLDGTPLETVNYQYNIRNWLELISGTKFKEDLDYTGQYTGGINSITYDYLDGSPYKLGYTYDKIYRLTTVQDIAAPPVSWDDQFREAFQYDKLGRFEKKAHGTTDLATWPKEYKYNDAEKNNQLLQITGVHPNSNNFEYDTNGNMKKDKNRAMTIKYDWRNMPVEYIFTDPQSGDIEVSRVNMMYDASGNRVLKRLPNFTCTPPQSCGYKSPVPLAECSLCKGTGPFVEDITNEVAYVDNQMVYTRNSGNLSLEYVNISGEGKVINPLTPGKTYSFYLKDHLGSVRKVIKNDGSGIEAKMYYSYGTMVKKAIAPSITDESREKFTGKEFDTDGKVDVVPSVHFGTDGMAYYYFGARYYDPEVGLFLSIDPMGQFFNLYSYGNSNPISGVDPTGMLWYNTDFAEADQWLSDFELNYYGTDLWYDFQEITRNEMIYIDQKAWLGSNIYGLEGEEYMWMRIQLDAMLDKNKNDWIMARATEELGSEAAKLMGKKWGNARHSATEAYINDYRNKYNVHPKTMADALKEGSGWTQLSPAEAIWHTFDAPQNVKFIKGNFEAVFDSRTGMPVTDPRNMATFNIVSHLESPELHKKYDVEPYFRHGTGYNDPTSAMQRKARVTEWVRIQAAQRIMPR